MYAFGVLLGKFIAGCIFGLFPLIVGIKKNLAWLGVVLMIAGGLLSFVHPILSVAVAVVSGVVLCIVRKKD